MLQQTQIQTVIPYYLKWVDALPAVQTVAESSEDFVLKLWEGLGYYARVRNFRHACKTVMEEFCGEIPSDPIRFKQLKGAGDYITAAVQSIAFGHPIPVIDGNVRRLCSRILSLPDPPERKRPVILDFLQKHIDRHKPGDFNQAVMDMARENCKPKIPLCDRCPVSGHCSAFINHTVDQFPVKEKKKLRPHYHIAVGVIWKDNCILVSRRKSDGLLGGLWEFPGGKILNGESPPECIQREVREELGIRVSIGDFINTIDHAYTHFSISMDSYHCRYQSGKPQAIECSDWKWIKPNQLISLAFPGANHKIFDNIPEISPFDH